MTISKKILTTIYCVLIMCIFLFAAVFIFIFSNMKTQLSDYNRNFEKFILEKTQTSYMHFTNDMLKEYSKMFVDEKNNKFIHTSNDISNLSRLATDIYSSDTKSEIGDNFALFPGVYYKNVKKELKLIYPFEKFLTYEDSSYYSNSKIFYYSDCGFFLNTSVGPRGTIESDMRKSKWYKDTKNNDAVVWSEPYADSITGETVVTCSKAVYDKNNKFVGAVAIDFDEQYFLDEVDDNSNKQEFFSKSFIIDSDGNVVMSSKNFCKDKYFNDTEYKDVIKKCLSSQESLNVFAYNNVTVSSSNLNVNNWKMCFVIDSEFMSEQMYDTQNIIQSFYNNMEQFLSDKISQFILSLAVVVIIMIILTIILSHSLTKYITSPLNKLSAGIKAMGDGELDYRIELNSKNEFAELATVINNVSQSLKKNIKRISYESAEKQKMLNEMELGKTIQVEMLPQDIIRKDVDIFAFMKPAKFVGGDFYDYFYTNDGSLAFVIGDVAGKGVSAALFMSYVKGIIKLAAKTAKFPKDVMKKVNFELSEQRNQECTFVTAIIGFLDTKTYDFKYCIAGHIPPLIKQKNKVTQLKTFNSLPLGVISNVDYKDISVKLKKGDTIVFYTDGVSDTMSEKETFLGQDAVIKEIENAKCESSKDLCAHVINKTKDFAGKKEQFDDTTIMAVRLRDLYYYKKIKATKKEVAATLDDINIYLKSNGILDTFYIILVLEELLTNIVKHGVPSMCNIEVSFERFKAYNKIIVVDDSIKFDPITIKDPVLSASAKNRKIGGLGLYLIRKNSKKMEYDREKNKNINIIIL